MRAGGRRRPSRRAREPATPRAAPGPEPQVEQAPPPPPPARRTAPRQAAGATARGRRPATPSLTLRRPEREGGARRDGSAIGVEPGERERVLALVRNQSGIVDNYDLRVDGLPDELVVDLPRHRLPGAVRLVGGTYEQEVEIHLHPPRAPEAEARVWELQRRRALEGAAARRGVRRRSRSRSSRTSRSRRRCARSARRAAARPTSTVDGRQQGERAGARRARGRRTPTASCSSASTARPPEIPPGADGADDDARPPAEADLDRPRGPSGASRSRTLTGEEAAAAAGRRSREAAAARPVAGREARAASAPRLRPRVFKPQVYEPGRADRPGRPELRVPQFQAPQFQGPQTAGAEPPAAEPAAARGRRRRPRRPAPLLPTQGVFRQQRVAAVVADPGARPARRARRAPATCCCRKNVTVPDVVGAKSTFDAEKKLDRQPTSSSPPDQAEGHEGRRPGHGHRADARGRREGREGLRGDAAGRRRHAAR